jgi:hypothetical protein
VSTLLRHQEALFTEFTDFFSLTFVVGSRRSPEPAKR